MNVSQLTALAAFAIITGAVGVLFGRRAPARPYTKHYYYGRLKQNLVLATVLAFLFGWMWLTNGTPRTVNWPNIMFSYGLGLACLSIGLWATKPRGAH